MTSRAVTSLTNPTVKAVRALHLRKDRDETGLFVAEGLKAVTEGIETGHAPRILMHGAEAADHPLGSISARALGPEPDVLVDTWTYPVRAEDVILLCSDGLTSMIPETLVAEILSTEHALDRAACFAGGHPISPRNGTSGALYPLAVLPGQVPVLRLQFPRAGAHPAVPLPRRTSIAV